MSNPPDSQDNNHQLKSAAVEMINLSVENGAGSRTDKQMVRFFFEGDRVDPEKSPEQLGLADGDFFTALIEQVGGAESRDSDAGMSSSSRDAVLRYTLELSKFNGDGTASGVSTITAASSDTAESRYTLESSSSNGDGTASGASTVSCDFYGPVIRHAVASGDYLKDLPDLSRVASLEPETVPDVFVEESVTGGSDVEGGGEGEVEGVSDERGKLVYEVERVLDHVTDTETGETQYLVKWADTWEWESSLMSQGQEKIANYWAGKNELASPHSSSRDESARQPLPSTCDGATSLSSADGNMRRQCMPSPPPLEGRQDVALGKAPNPMVSSSNMGSNHKCRTGESLVAHLQQQGYQVRKVGSSPRSIVVSDSETESDVELWSDEERGSGRIGKLEKESGRISNLERRVEGLEGKLSLRATFGKWVDVDFSDPSVTVDRKILRNRGGWSADAVKTDSDEGAEIDSNVGTGSGSSSVGKTTSDVDLQTDTETESDEERDTETESDVESETDEEVLRGGRGRVAAARKMVTLQSGVARWDAFVDKAAQAKGKHMGDLHRSGSNFVPPQSELTTHHRQQGDRVREAATFPRAVDIRVVYDKEVRVNVEDTEASSDRDCEVEMLRRKRDRAAAAKKMIMNDGRVGNLFGARVPEKTQLQQSSFPKLGDMTDGERKGVERWEAFAAKATKRCKAGTGYLHRSGSHFVPVPERRAIQASADWTRFDDDIRSRRLSVRERCLLDSLSPKFQFCDRPVKSNTKAGAGKSTTTFPKRKWNWRTSEVNSFGGSEESVIFGSGLGDEKATTGTKPVPASTVGQREVIITPTRVYQSQDDFDKENLDKEGRTAQFEHIRAIQEALMESLKSYGRSRSALDPEDCEVVEGTLEGCDAFVGSDGNMRVVKVGGDDGEGGAPSSFVSFYMSGPKTTAEGKSGRKEGVEGAEQKGTVPEMGDGTDDVHEMEVVEVQSMDEGVDDESGSDVTSWEDFDAREETAEGEFEVLNEVTLPMERLEYHLKPDPKKRTSPSDSLNCGHHEKEFITHLQQHGHHLHHLVLSVESYVPITVFEAVLEHCPVLETFELGISEPYGVKYVSMKAELEEHLRRRREVGGRKGRKKLFVGTRGRGGEVRSLVDEAEDGYVWRARKGDWVVGVGEQENWEEAEFCEVG
ncbi:hypothetical protein HDV00_004614 [Rhizophlyctis rosea]|nr:hypothetical protein HDV00_004614 [Rhizophlyctis rosea]